MTPEEKRWALRSELKVRVGGFFHNVQHAPGLCTTCYVPASSGQLCSQCLVHRQQFGDRLASRVFILTYARGWTPGGTAHQSAHTVRAYKRIPPASKCAQDLALMVLAATFVHGNCMRGAVGQDWSALTFVPSASRPGPEHPVAELARNVVGMDSARRRLRLEAGPKISAPERVVYADRFAVPDAYRDRVVGQHVLLVDDTWTTGSKIQSAAVALRDAGAAKVTALCVARWCNYGWPDHKNLLDSCTVPYDAFVCPVTGGDCPTF
jgi:hypothetical protein